MALTKATQDNVFLGASIFRGKDKFYVYKVNAKTLYIGEIEEKVIAGRWENRPIGQKWIEFMKKQNAKKVTYDGLTISTEEANKKAGFLAIKEARENTKDWLGKKGKALVKELFRISRNEEVIIKGKKVIKKKGKCVLLLRNDVGNNKIYIIKMRDDGHVLLRLNDAYLFYDINTEVYTRFDKELHKNGKEVIFPKTVTFIKERKIAV